VLPYANLRTFVAGFPRAVAHAKQHAKATVCIGGHEVGPGIAVEVDDGQGDRGRGVYHVEERRLKRTIGFPQKNPNLASPEVAKYNVGKAIPINVADCRS